MSMKETIKRKGQKSIPIYVEIKHEIIENRKHRLSVAVFHANIIFFVMERIDVF